MLSTPAQEESSESTPQKKPQKSGLNKWKCSNI